MSAARRAGAQPPVDVRIERLVLDGIELTRRERAALGPAIERALNRRLDGRPPVRAQPTTRRVERIGRDVAAVLHDAIPGRSRG